MEKKLTESQKDTLKKYRDNGQYVDAYKFLKNIYDSALSDSGEFFFYKTQNYKNDAALSAWFDVGIAVNGNDGSICSQQYKNVCTSGWQAY